MTRARARRPIPEPIASEIVVDHLTSMAGDHRRAQNLIGTLFHMYLYEALVFPIGNRAVDIMHEHGESLYRNGFSALPNIQADMSNFRIGIGAPGYRQSAQSLAAPKERVLNHDARRGILNVGEFMLEAYIAGRIDPSVVVCRKSLTRIPVSRVILDAEQPRDSCLRRWEPGQMPVRISSAVTVCFVVIADEIHELFLPPLARRRSEC